MIKTRSMLVLLKADEIVKPPMSSIIVGENIAEKTNLSVRFVSRTLRNNKQTEILIRLTLWLLEVSSERHPHGGQLGTRREGMERTWKLRKAELPIPII